MSTGREVAGEEEGEVECPVDQFQDHPPPQEPTDGVEAMAGTRYGQTEWRGIVQEGHRRDHRHMGTVTSGDNNTIHRKVCTNQ